MKKSRFLSSLLLMVTLLTANTLPGLALEPLELECKNAILVNATYDEILSEKYAHDKAYPASITKVTTALLVLEAVEDGALTFDTMVTADGTIRQGLVDGGSTANIKAGETMSVEDLLYCLLLPSANEAANILAVAVDGSIEAFVTHMNERVTELGCKGTHYVNPHGLHDPNHYTTAYDTYLIFDAAYQHELFRTIISSADHTVPATNISDQRYFYNTNALISNLYRWGYVYDYCVGGKTGTTDEAGGCLVSVAEKNDTVLISVVLGSGDIDVNGEIKKGQFTESTKQFEYGFNNFHRVTITKGDEPVDKVAVTLSREADEVMVKPQGSITRTLPIDLNLEDIESEITLFSDTVEAPVEAGQVLGSMKLSYEGEEYGTLDLVAVTSVERSELLYKKAQFLNFWQQSGTKVVVGIVGALVLILALRLLVFRKRRRYRGGSSPSRSHYRGSRR